jgi:hypothetical protein
MRLSKMTIVLTAAVFGYALFRLFTTRVDKVTDTRLWIYRADARPVASARVDVEVRHPPGRGDFERVASVVTGPTGHATFERVRVRKPYLPLPHGAPPDDYEQRLFAEVDGESQALGTTHSARTAQFVFEDGRLRHGLLFLHDYDPFRDRDAFSMQCARDVEALADAESYLAGPAGPRFGAEVRARVFAQAKAMGMVPRDEAFDGYVAIEVRRAPAAHCTAMLFLTDAKNRTPPGFDTP